MSPKPKNSPNDIESTARIAAMALVAQVKKLLEENPEAKMLQFEIDCSSYQSCETRQVKLEMPNGEILRLVYMANRAEAAS